MSIDEKDKLIEQLQNRIKELENHISDEEDVDSILQKKVLSRALLNIPTDAILLVDLEMNILDVNETAARRYVTFVENIKGTKLPQWFSDKNAGKIEKYIREVIDNKHSVRFEEYKSGSWTDVVFYPMFNVHKKVDSVAVVSRDITKLKNTENQLNESDTKHYAVLKTIPDPLIKCTRSGVVNEVLVQPGPFPLEIDDSCVGKPIFEIIPASYVHKLVFDIEKAFQSKSVRIFEMKLKKNKSDIFVEARIFAADESGFLVIFRDVTDRKVVEEKLVEAKEKAELADRLKTNFLAQMSHEIRTPVTAIISFASILSENLYHDVEQDLQRCFDSIVNGCNRLTRTMDLLLNMAQIQAGEFELNKKEFDIVRVLEELVEEFSPMAGVNGILLIFDNESSSSKIIADEYSIRQVLHNLIDNAVKYTERGNILVRLFEDYNDSISVEIKDSGIGIREEYLNDLFTPFSQEDSGYTRKFDGNGLGLAVVKHFCDLNDASVNVESRKGTGSTFTVTFRK